MRQRIVIAAVALLLTPLALMAQPQSNHSMRPGGPMGGDPMDRIERLVEFLELSDAQRVQIEESMVSRREDRQAAAETLRSSNETLQRMLGGESPDATAVGTKVIEIHGLRQQMGADQKAQMTALRDLLTPEQVQKLDALIAARDFARSDRGPRGERKGRHDGANRPSGR